MHSLSAFIFTLLLCSSIGASELAEPPDWNQWRGPERNGSVPGSDWPSSFVGDMEEQALALDRASGEIRWSTSAAPASSADARIVLRGEYEWSNGGSDELTAEFTPSGAGKWDVKFRFCFSGKSNTWNGSAMGDLSNGGELTGTATWKKSGRRWVFSGVMQDGELRGSHAEVRGEQESASGTFWLAPSSD